MKTVLEIIEKHFGDATDETHFRLWAFGFTNLSAHTNMELLDIWNKRKGEECEKFASSERMLYAVMQMIVWYRTDQGHNKFDNTFANTTSKCENMASGIRDIQAKLEEFVKKYLDI